MAVEMDLKEIELVYIFLSLSDSYLYKSDIFKFF